MEYTNKKYTANFSMLRGNLQSFFKFSAGASFSPLPGYVPHN